MNRPGFMFKKLSSMSFVLQNRPTELCIYLI